ncbi:MULTISPECIES: 4'-phosphopantetheinyl transferase superfamily protein [unclassified Mesorhizobium]|uniref:4'-phosphopantetheinyl transferase family protein n=1 Tax=unclassified Mesorhizobium TaxID=325217 RepID=UPI003334E1FA
MLLELEPNGVDLWLTYFDEISAPDILSFYRNVLTEDERGQESRFHFSYHRRRYLVTRAAVRSVLSRYVHVEPQDWRFRKNAFGRPSIANLPNGVPDIDFNISHTKGLIVVGIVGGKFFGVDVENVRLGSSLLDIADQFFSPEEVVALAAEPCSQQHGRFFEYWTLKEAYIKARGLGLAIPLHLFSFHFGPTNTITMSAREELEDAPTRWKFWQLRPKEDYLIAACSEQSVPGAFQLTVREIFPFMSERAIECVPSRTSP